MYRLFFIVFLKSFCVFSLQGSIELDIYKSIELAHKSSFDLQIQKAEYESAQSEKSQALRGTLPSLEASGNFLFYNKNVNAEVGKVIGTSYVPERKSDAALTLVQPIVGLVPTIQKARVASKKSELFENKIKVEKLEAQYRGAKGFIDSQKAYQVYKISKASYDVSLKQRRDYKIRYQAGKITENDYLKFVLSASEMKSQMEDAHFDFELSLVTLKEILQIPQETTIILPEEYKPVWNASKKKIKAKSLMYDALKNRPDVSAAQSNLDMQRRLKSSKYMEYLPEVNFVTQYSRNFEARDLKLPDIKEGDTFLVHAVDLPKNKVRDNWYYGIEFKWKLWDWGVRQSSINMTSAAVKKAKLEKDKADSNARLDISKGYLSLKTSLEKLETAKVSESTAYDNYITTKARYDVGQATALDVVTSYKDYVNAKGQLANVSADLDSSYLYFKKSKGQDLLGDL
jgi:outer membrane protein TolC